MGIMGLLAIGVLIGMKTLEQLKAENAELEAKAAATAPVEVDEVEEDAVEETTEEAEDSGESGQEESAVTDTENWMRADEQESADSGDDVQVPLAAHTKMRGKLKARIHEQDSELEQLKAKIEALEQGRPVEAKVESKPMPKLEDHDYDDAKYAEAMQEWVAHQVQSHVGKVTQQSTQQSEQQRQKAKLDEAVDGHYQRAAKLAEQAGITPEVYQSADLKVRQAIESVMPQKGDLVTDQLISRLGEGSEKVMYYLGRNAQAQEKLRASLRDDPTGISAALYLGELKTSVAKPQKQVSRAPKPAPQVRGDESALVSADAKKMAERYRKAHKSGNAQEAYNTRKAARQAGVDVSNW